jgi:hypothetical protein
LAFCLALAFVGLQPAAAQLAPTAAPAGAFPANVAHNSTVGAIRPGIPGSPHPPLGQANPASQQGDRTKVVRIYSGSGYFDGVLAAKLRPILAKAFASSEPDMPQSVPGTAAAGPKAENQTNAAEAPHL